MPPAPEIRLSALNSAPLNEKGRYVLYWMTASRRTRYNYGLQHAAWWCRRLGVPLMVLEALRCDYPHASDRLHAFVLQGMADNQKALARRGVRYYPFVETKRGKGKGLLTALAGPACLVVADEFPAFFLPHMLAAAGKKLPIRLETVDSCGLFPLRAADRDYPTAYAFRRLLQRQLPGYLAEPPSPDPLAGPSLGPPPRLPAGVAARWPEANKSMLNAAPRALASLPIDHEVAPGPIQGGQEAACARLKQFIANKLPLYADEHNQPDADAASGLSPYLHFGHISAHQIFRAVTDQQGWEPSRLSLRTDGKRSGWWGMDQNAEAFLDQLVTWRELGYNFCFFRPDYQRFSSLPDWAKKTLEEHAGDQRSYVYAPGMLEDACTHDELWNAAQRQLLEEGIIQNYLRMLWGKKILAWSPGPRLALKVMLEINDRYALDGRDPNSISGIFWVLGRFDRAWQERPVFGKLRYMSSASARRKLHLTDYLARWGQPED